MANIHIYSAMSIKSCLPKQHRRIMKNDYI